MSPTLVREGPARLSTDGSVKQTGKKEANIAKITEDDIQQICKVRKILEPYAASLIAKKFSSDNNVEDPMGKEKHRLLTPWEVRGVEFCAEEKWLNIAIDFRRDSTLVRPPVRYVVAPEVKLIGSITHVYDESCTLRSFQKKRGR